MALAAQEQELTRLIGLAQRDRSRVVLTAELERVQALIRASQASAPAAPAPATAPTVVPKKLGSTSASASTEYSTISKYAFDGIANKFVKVYITLPGLEKLADDQIEAVFEERSLRISVTGLPTPPANQRLNVATLCAAVRPEACSWVRKPSDMLLVKLRKAEEGEEWGSLDNSAAKKEAQQKERQEANKVWRAARCSRTAALTVTLRRRLTPPRYRTGQVDRGAAAADVRGGGRGRQGGALQGLGGRAREAGVAEGLSSPLQFERVGR